MSQLTYGAEDSIETPARYEVPVTGFTISGGTESILVINPAGTLATGTLNLPSSPKDGRVYKITSSQTQTALTVAAATGDSIGAPAVTALVAGTTVGWVYRLANRTWFRCV